MKDKFLTILLLCSFIVIFAAVAGQDGLLQAEDKPGFLKRDTLTGDWGGLRSKLADKGISLEMIYTGEMASIMNGGLQKKTVYLDNKDITLTIDAEKLMGWNGTEFFFYVLGNDGDSPTILD